MDHDHELQREREYTAYVQQILFAIISQSKGHADFQTETIRMMLADAWDELRMKPTALSPQDLEQLNTEIDRFLARKAFSENRAQRYEQMLLKPFFARVDFTEQGSEDREKIVIGMYCLKDEQGDLLVHDWRAPVCSLYYDSMPGQASYHSPSGVISGEMWLKRQYSMEDGRLKYYVDTEYSIDDGILLDILSGATSNHMRQIVATIQSEQNAAIRHEQARVLSVIGGAGSGKTSVAMHRAAYLMYHHRNILSANLIAILSPSDAFSEYISTVLPDLGEENVRTLTLHGILVKLLTHPVETPAQQTEILLASNAGCLRRQSVAFKSGGGFIRMLDSFAERYAHTGPAFHDLLLDQTPLATTQELNHMYRMEFRALNPAQRILRIQAILESHIKEWEQSFYKHYESQFIGTYRGKELEFITRMAIAKRLHPLRGEVKQMLSIHPLVLYTQALTSAPPELREAASENAQAGICWWEDSFGAAYLMLKLGFARPDKSVRHLLIDEAQDYPEIALRLLRENFSSAHVTILGDPNQRTLPSLPACQPERWGELFQEKNAPLVYLSRSYRSTMEITSFCNAFLPDSQTPVSFGRNGEAPESLAYNKDSLKQCLIQWQEHGYKRIAVITRTQAEAELLKRSLRSSHLQFVISDDDMASEHSIFLGGYHQMKGLEFDAVAVVWPNCDKTDDERRRLYTACSRALHALKLFEQEK